MSQGKHLDPEDPVRGGAEATAAILLEAIESIAEGFVIYGPDDRLLICNKTYRELYAASEPVMRPGARFEDILRYGVDRGQYPEAGDTPETREKWLLERLADHKTAQRRLTQQIGPDRWLQIEERKLPDGHTVGIRSDISELKRAQSDSARFGAIMERSAHEIFLVDAATLKIIDANQGARENLGYSASELRGMTFLDINPDFGLEEISDLHAPLMRRKYGQIDLDSRHRRKDGSFYPCRIKLYRDDAAEESMVVAFVEDLTHQRSLEEEVAQRRRDLETLLRNIPDIVSRATPDTTLTYANDRYTEFLGLPRDRIIGASFLDFVPEQHREHLEASLAALTPENPICLTTEDIIDGSGRYKTLRWSNQKVFEDGEAIEIVSVGRDVSDLATLNSALNDANDELQGFAYAASHDLRSPIQTLRSLLDILEEDHKATLPDDARAIVERLSGVSDRMMRLSDAVLDYARFSGAPAETSKFDCAELLEDIIADLEGEVVATGASIEVCEMPRIRAVRLQFGRVFQNLISNALKFKKDSRRPCIRLTSRRLPDHWSFSVRDNGIGLPDEEAEAIFAPFRRLHGGHSFPGSGLGLTICRRIVQGHGGSISVRSNDDSPGVTFTFTIRDNLDERSLPA